jgi:hypothetical protein
LQKIGLGIDENERERLLDEHLKNLRDARRTVLQDNKTQSDNDLWAIGQHYGMCTPFLDWTKCPFIAAYFAFSKEAEKGQTECRVVYGLNNGVTRLLRKKKKGDRIMKEKTRRFIEFPSVSAVDDERLKAQRGLFTKALNGVDVKTNVEKCEKKRPGGVFLIQIKIPDIERKECLESLENESGIHQATMFPDNWGIASDCNLRLSDICRQ